jgi:type VI secretion system protein ImpM
MSVCVFGKLPSQPEFLKVHVSAPLDHVFTRWLEAAHETLVRSGQSLKPEPLRFVFTAAGSSEALVGVLAASRDSVGRAFPLAVYTHSPVGAWKGRISAGPLAYSGFLLGAEGVLGMAGSQDASGLSLGLKGLPADPDWVSALDELSRLGTQSAKGVLEQLNSLPNEPSPEYGLHAFGLACASVKDTEPASAKVVLDCPGPVEGPWLWLELWSRLTRWPSGVPSLLWSAQTGRALVGMGPMPDAQLVFWNQPEKASNLLWPLKTQVKAAMERAKSALAPKVRDVLSKESALKDLTSAFS